MARPRIMLDGTQLVVRVPRDLLTSLAAAARLLGMSQSQAAREALAAWVSATAAAVDDQDREDNARG